MSKTNPLIVTVERLTSGKGFAVRNLQGFSIPYTTDKDSPVKGLTYIPSWRLDKAAEGKFALQETYSAKGVEWREYKGEVNTVEASTITPSELKIPMAANLHATTTGSFLPSETQEITVTAPVVENTHEAITAFIKSSYKLKPPYLKMIELKWKYMIRSAMRGRNVMLIGASGSGKTLAATTLPKVLGRPWELFALGATQDPRSFLIGNTHLNKETGTFFDESLFVKMIQVPNAIIILDEFTRAEPEAHNILMSVLDVNQRYLRIEEAVGSPTIKVAEGVTFVSTANIGNEYTATKVMDKAVFERWIVIEMDLLNDKEEAELLGYLYPSMSKKSVEYIAALANTSRIEMGTENCKLSHPISTRMSVETAGLMFDGFNLAEACEAAIYPFYESEGGNESERTYIKMAVQKYVELSVQNGGEPAGAVEDLFPPAEVKKAPK